MGLISVGNVIVDLTIGVPALPPAGGDVVATGGQHLVGGSFNTLFAAVRQGLPASYAGAHGTGPFGDLVRAELASAGIEVVQQPSLEWDTGFDVALTDSLGERTFITVFGAEAKLSAAQLAEVSPQPGDYVHISGYGLLERTNAAVLAPWVGRLDSSVIVLVDPGPLVAEIPPLVWAAVLERADWLTCNGREAEILTGHSDLEQATAILARSRPGVIARAGPAGAWLIENGRVTHVPAYPVEVLDSNGAGDAHSGAFLAGLARGESATEATRLANVCAALAVTRSGPATAPTLAEVLAASAGWVDPPGTGCRPRPNMAP